MLEKKKSSEYQSAYNNYAHGLYYCNIEQIQEEAVCKQIKDPPPTFSCAQAPVEMRFTGDVTYCCSILCSCLSIMFKCMLGMLRLFFYQCRDDK